MATTSKGTAQNKTLSLSPVPRGKHRFQPQQSHNQMVPSRQLSQQSMPAADDVEDIVNSDLAIMGNRKKLTTVKGELVKQDSRPVSPRGGILEYYHRGKDRGQSQLDSHTDSASLVPGDIRFSLEQSG